METKETRRNSAIELLRIIAMVGVVILHYNNFSIGGGFKFVNSGSLQEKYLFFSESLFICAVNLFVMISAYFLSTTQKRNLVKVVELIVQVMVFRLAFYFADILLGYSKMSTLELLRNIAPSKYFVILYAVLYIISPYINTMIKNISSTSFKRLVIIMILLFSVWNMGVDFIERFFRRSSELSTVGLDGDQGGYTIVNFIMVYFIGAYIRLNNISLSKTKSIIGIIACVALIFIEKIVGEVLYGSSIAWNYNNPLVILLPVFLILFFTKLQFESKIINELAKAAFTCYLFHIYFMPKLGVEKFVNGNIFILILHQFGSAIAIYLASYIVYKIYDVLTKPIIKCIAPKCEKIDISL